MLIGRIKVTFVHNFVLRNYDLKWQWSATQKNRGRSKKIQGQTALKNGSGSLAVGSYLQRGSTPLGIGYGDLPLPGPGEEGLW